MMPGLPRPPRSGRNLRSPCGRSRKIACASARALPHPQRVSSTVTYPTLLRLRQHSERPRVADVAAQVRSELERLDLGQTIRPGQSIALTAGSRGIANIPLVLRTVAHFLRDLGARPFL